MTQRDHLHRLRNVWLKNPVYFLTVCTTHRRQILAGHSSASILVESWHAATRVHGWVVGRYVIMPNHVHFFAAPLPDGKPLSGFMRDWKRWTARKIAVARQIEPPIWQLEFFDHLLRSPIEDYLKK